MVPPVKLPALILAMATAAVAATDGPAETALRFLEKVRAGTVDLRPGHDTALAGQTGERKREEIRMRLDRLADDLGDGPLELGPVREQDGFAAVLVRRVGGFDPARLRVFPVALLQRGGAWLAAPVPASFENTGLGYAGDLRGKLTALEHWMQREQVEDLAKLRDQSGVRLRESIRKALPPEQVAGMSPMEVVDRFLEACRRRDVPAALGLLGGLAGEPPDDWDSLVRAVDAAAASEARVVRPWRLLLAGDVLRFVVNDEPGGPDGGTIAIACIDPQPGEGRRQRIERIPLELSRHDDMWRITLPAAFHRIMTPYEESHDEFPAEGASASLAAGLARHRSNDAGTADLREAAAAVLAALRAPDPSAILHWIDAGGSHQETVDGLLHAMDLWWALNDPAVPRLALPLDVHEHDGMAAASFQFLALRSTERFDLRCLHFRKTDGVWRWTTPAATRSHTAAWAAEQQKVRGRTWTQTLLDGCQRIEALAAPAPGEEACRSLAGEWLAALGRGDLREVMARSARLATPASDGWVVRNLGYEFASARKVTAATALTAVHAGTQVSVVGIRSTADGGEIVRHYPVVTTAAGPRVLAEIELAASGARRSRAFLNKSALERLAAFHPGAAQELGDWLARQEAGAAADGE